MKISTMLLLDIESMIPIECAAGAAGAYGAAVPLSIRPGPYLVRCDADVVVRVSASEELRTGAAGNKIEFPVSPSTPLPVLFRSGRVVVAARDAAAIVWLVPLVSIDEA